MSGDQALSTADLLSEYLAPLHKKLETGDAKPGEGLPGIVQAIRKVLRRYGLRKHLSDPHLLDELHAEALYAIVEAIGAGRFQGTGREQFHGFAYGVARNAVRDTLRRLAASHAYGLQRATRMGPTPQPTEARPYPSLLHPPRQMLSFDEIARRRNGDPEGRSEATGASLSKDEFSHLGHLPDYDAEHYDARGFRNVPFSGLVMEAGRRTSELASALELWARPENAPSDPGARHAMREALATYAGRSEYGRTLWDWANTDESDDSEGPSLAEAAEARGVHQSTVRAEKEALHRLMSAFLMAWLAADGIEFDAAGVSLAEGLGVPLPAAAESAQRREAARARTHRGTIACQSLGDAHAAEGSTEFRFFVSELITWVLMPKRHSIPLPWPARDGAPRTFAVPPL